MRLAACLLVASLLASACSVRSPAVEYWTLAALTPAPAAWDEAGPAVAIGPVALPRHLDRPQVLVRHDVGAGRARRPAPLGRPARRRPRPGAGRQPRPESRLATRQRLPGPAAVRAGLPGAPRRRALRRAARRNAGAERPLGDHARHGWPGAGGRAQRDRGFGRRELRVVHRRTFARRGATRGADRRQAQDVVRGLGAPRGPVVGVRGFEPPTFCSRSRRATRLRYTPYSVR
jgi:hypothetical protein